MSQELPQDIQQKIRTFQNLQAQLQSLNEQRFSIEAQIKELESATEYLNKADDDTKVFKSIGGLMIETQKIKSLEDLNENKELLETRNKKIKMNIERIQSKYDTLKDDINSSLKNRMG